MSNSCIKQNAQTYWIDAWGGGYFAINDLGHVVVRPERNGQEGDLFLLTQALMQRGIEAPILIRFNGIIHDRIHYLQQAFQAAINAFGYRNRYQIAYPVKVNPQKHVVETVLHTGRSYNIGLEVGSKPELTAMLALEEHPQALLLCNGYKDAEYIELALLSTKVGRRTIIIIEQLYELALVYETAQKLGVEAEIGFRMKPSNKGSGRWQCSGGDQAKFGLNMHEIISCLDYLQQQNKSSWLKLLHFHIGSQITSIEAIKKSLKEASRMYTELAKACPSLEFFDVGGGLAVDYEGSQTASDSSMNYTVEEYARDVIATIGEACVQADLPDPVVITESGRALVAHHSVLITEVIDVTSSASAIDSLPAPPSNHPLLETLHTLYQELQPKTCLETLHDTLELKETILEAFVHGSLNLRERAYAEKVQRHLIAKIRLVSKELPYVPEEVAKLDHLLHDTYFCNFSVFQSLPDAWAIHQLFPVMPIHCLDQTPDHRAVLADLSCDSDGKIDTFIGKKEESHALPLHEYKQMPYYVGVFLVGAYQEILGGLHNLFGDTNVVHVDLDSDNHWVVSQVVEGDTIEEVLQYAQYNPQQLMERLRALIERSLKQGKLTPLESANLQKKYKKFLESYTYLVV